MPYYQTDWSTTATPRLGRRRRPARGSSLIRLRPADYGNDPDNWMASNVGGTPGAANIAFDPIAADRADQSGRDGECQLRQIALDVDRIDRSLAATSITT